MTPRYEYWQGKDGNWHWHLQAANGEIVSQGEPDGYTSKWNAKRAIAGNKWASLFASVVEVEASDGPVVNECP